MSEHVLEIREPGQPPRRVGVSGSTEVGRNCDGILLGDPAVSRRHLRLDVAPDGLSAVDYGSANGTTVNGRRMSAPTLLRPGDELRLGDTVIAVLADVPPGPARSVPPVAPPAPAVAAPTTAPPAGPPANPPADPFVAPPSYDDPSSSPYAEPPSPAPPAGAVPPAAAVPRSVLAAMAHRSSEHAVVRFVPGTTGERLAASVLASARTARRRLANFGSESWGVVPQICLVDPFPDPHRPGELVTSGTVVDASRSEIWMVVTPEAPPESLERPLAVLFGASLPAADELEVLIEGYGLWLAEAPAVDDELRVLDLPPLRMATGELRSAMALSLVRHLIDREGEEALRRFLGSARRDQIDEAATDAYGLSLTGIEERWRIELDHGAERVKLGEFFGLSLRYMRPYKRRQIEIVGYMLLGLAFTVLYPFAARRLFDTALPSGEYSQVVQVLGALAVAFLITSLANLRRTYLSAYVSGSIVRDIRCAMFDRLQTLSARWYSNSQQGDVLSRLFTDVAVVEAGLSNTLREGGFQVLSLVVSAIVLLTLDVQLGIIVLLGAPLVAIVYRVMAKGAEKRSVAVQERTSGLLNVAAENYQAQSVTRVFGLQSRERDRFGRASDRLFRAERRLILFGGMFGLSVDVIVTSLRLGILAYGTWLILQGHLTVGGLVAFTGVMGEVLAPVASLTGIGQQIQASTGALKRINAILDEVPDVADAPGAVTLAPLAHEVRLSGVSFSYTPERRVLEDVDALVHAGSRVAFVGPSGSGKSTILGLLQRLQDPDSGAVAIDGQDLRSVTLDSLRAQIGVVHQDTFLFDTTVRENIALGRLGATEAEVEAAARAAEVHEFILTMPRGYDTLVGERGAMLSGGQRQRLAIARALIRDPRLLLLDEATSALDPRTERQITETLERIGRGRTIIAITHRLTSVVDYDQIFVISEGRLVEQGTHGELVARGGIYARLWSEQTGAELAAGTPPLDVEAALARIPLFAELDGAGLADVASRLRAEGLPAGELCVEGGGRLVLLARGRARVLVPSLGGAQVTTAELGPGETFGLGALLGSPLGAALEAIEPTTLLVLDDSAFATLAVAFPSVGLALGGGTPGPAPVTGRVLTRTTLGLRATTPPDLRGAVATMPPPMAVPPGPRAGPTRSTASLRVVPPGPPPGPPAPPGPPPPPTRGRP